MATKIRLARGGRKAAPHYSIVVIESSRKQTGKFIEKIGHYHPLKNDQDKDRIILESDRLKYWLSVGAIPTDSIIRFMKILNISGFEKFSKKVANAKYIGVSKKTIAEDKKKLQAELAEKKKAKDLAIKEAAKEAAKLVADNAV